jgi:hypothetical protein
MGKLLPVHEAEEDRWRFPVTVWEERYWEMYISLNKEAFAVLLCFKQDF